MKGTRCYAFAPSMVDLFFLQNSTFYIASSLDRLSIKRRKSFTYRTVHSVRYLTVQPCNPVQSYPVQSYPVPPYPVSHTQRAPTRHTQHFTLTSMFHTRRAIRCAVICYQIVASFVIQSVRPPVSMHRDLV